MNVEFARHVSEGLNSSPRWLSSRFIYDAVGSKLFEQIMHLPEYYLTRAEFSILERESGAIADALPAWPSFDVIEFGAGDGTKTRLLLQELLKSRQLRYVPIDISDQALLDIEVNMRQWLPELELAPLHAEYFSGLESLRHSGRPKLVLFLGSNIGNFNQTQTLAFLRQMQQALSPGDCLLAGFDLKKDPKRILAAYNDSQGVTQAFNLNLLHRINRELGGQFIPSQFEFVPSYQPESGEMHAFLVSKQEQKVYIEALEQHFHFPAWAAIHTEVSRKYDLATIEALADDSGFGVSGHFFDAGHDFVDSLWAKADV
ncbi:MAG: L-histidine N(alpha)-methyltransferase [Candidatus Melainabacteria bacterium HGW-Melainabacteria-1]|nr:MAG: L-histidine N(alpha)-methyltransferase [Candidatus Melainabacteria bacterium HGW-Melainabacteria-1]